MGRFRTIKTAGIRGVVKTIWNSVRHTRSVSRLVMHPNVITALSSGATFDIRGRLVFGIHDLDATHPELRKSKFSATDSATVRHTGESHATIGPGTVLHVEGEFSMGDSYINCDGRVMCGDAITIGDGCAIAWGVTLLDDTRHKFSVNGTQRTQSAPIQIGNDVWIGHGASVQKGVTIGDGAVVASNSTVTNDVPEKSLVGGTPATVIERDVSWGPDA